MREVVAPSNRFLGSAGKGSILDKNYFLKGVEAMEGNLDLNCTILEPPISIKFQKLLENAQVNLESFFPQFYVKNLLNSSQISS